MARRRGRFSRFVRRAGRRASSGGRRIARRGGRVLRMVKGRMSPIFGGLPRWAKPSTFAAGTGIAVSTTTLIFTPLSDGDSWIHRAHDGYSVYQKTKNPFDILNYDQNGNGLPEVLAAQLKQNAPSAIAQSAAYGGVAGFLKWIGM